MLSISSSALKQITEIFNKRKKAIGLSGYTVRKMIGQGGSANVYLVSGRSDSTEYVLRVSAELKSPYSHDIFNVREMEILSELKKNSQPHVVQYIDAFDVDLPDCPRYYCAVMKRLIPLSKYRLSDDGEEIAVRLGSDFLPLLQSFMDKEIIHRDIKPENIFYDGDFRNRTGFLLGDFGIAKRDTDTSVTPTGTESTMAPEVRGLDSSLPRDRSRCDMYSLGIVMYRYLNEGVYPSNRERVDKMPPDRNPFPEPRYGSDRLKALVLKATSYDPADRFESPQAMLRELQKCEEYRKYMSAKTRYDVSENQSEEMSENPVSVGFVVRRVKVSDHEDKKDGKKATLSDTQKKAATTSPSDVKSVLLKLAPVIAVIAAVVIAAAVIAAVIGSNRAKSGGDADRSVVTESDATVSNLRSLSEMESVSVGDHFSFGSYPQTAKGEVQPIEWRVLDLKDGKALVISEKLLDYVPYNTTRTDMTWNDCSLRKWMNNDFLNKAFSEEEQKKIAPFANENLTNRYGVEGGKPTYDKIFALNVKQAEQYFSSENDRIAYITDYVYIKSSGNEERSEFWWLRSPGFFAYYASFVYYNGDVYEYGNNVDYDKIAVRPALWVKVG